MHERVMVTVTILPYWCYGCYSVIRVAVTVYLLMLHAV